MKPFEYFEPTSLDEARRLLARPKSFAIAGGTDLLVRLKKGRPADRIVSLRRIASLRGQRGDWIGPLTTLDELTHPLLRQAALQMASPQVRALATIGGNLCNASPAADLAPPLLCLDATLETTSRTIPLREFFCGPGRTLLERDEIVTGIRVPAVAGRHAFLKFSPRRAMDLAIVSVAAAAGRVALGAVAPTPILVPPSPDEAARLCSPIDDVRASARYRRELVRVLTRRALEAVS